MNETIAEKISNLNMKLADWFVLAKFVKPDEYHKIVNDYQARKELDFHPHFEELEG